MIHPRDWESDKSVAARVRFPEQADPQRQKVDEWLPGLELSDGMGTDQSWAWCFFGMMGLF